MKRHEYRTAVRWDAQGGPGTTGYRTYPRAHEIEAAGKPPIPASSDPAFRGDAERYNPEELLVASLSSCHMLWYLHLCSRDGIVVLAYRDEAAGEMEEDAAGGGRFVSVTLHPIATLAAGSDEAAALALHHEAHRLCFIARSVNFEVEVEPGVDRL